MMARLCVFVFTLCCAAEGLADPALLFANRGNVRLVELENPETTVTVFDEYIEDAVAVDFNHALGELCWVDIGSESIRCSRVEAPRAKPYKLVYQNTAGPEGVAIDWITGNVYWTDSRSKRIEVTDRLGRFRRGLFWLRVDQPRSIALLPSHGLVFWSDWGATAKIEVASMDGRTGSRRVFVSRDIEWPNGITIDYLTQTVYWTDGGDTRALISAQRLDGSGRRVVAANTGLRMQPFSVCVFNERVYWTDMRNQSIHSARKDGGGDFRTLLSGGASGGSLQPLDVHVYAASRQPRPPAVGAASAACSSCSHLCLLASTDSGSGGGGGDVTEAAAVTHSCACPTGLLPANDTTCRPHEEKVLFLAQREQIRAMSLDTNDRWLYRLPVRSVRSILAIDYLPATDSLLWLDEQTHKLESVTLPAAGSIGGAGGGGGGAFLSRRTLLADLKRPGSLAVDWLANNVYWTDIGDFGGGGLGRDAAAASAASGQIMVARLPVTTGGASSNAAVAAASVRKALVQTDLREPRTLALHPAVGLLFWSDWGRRPAVIERAALDGSERRALVTADLLWPNSLTVDRQRHLLYWSDADSDRIELCRLDGGGRRAVLTADLPHLLSVSVFDGWLYWIDNRRATVQRARSLTGEDRSVLAEKFADMRQVLVVSRSRISQQDAASGGAASGGATNQCASNNGGCSHLCLYTPTGSKCHCPLGMELIGDRMSCVVPAIQLLLSYNGSIVSASLQSSTATMLSSVSSGSSFSSVSPLPLVGVEQAGHLDYSVEDEFVYWSDQQRHTISRAHMNGSDQQAIVRLGDESIEDLCVNEQDGNLYWLGGASGRVYVARTDGAQQRVLTWRANSAHHRLSLAIDTVHGYLLWSEWRPRSAIMRAHLDGSHVTSLVDLSVTWGSVSGGRALALTVDPTSSRLYWLHLPDDTDAAGSLQSVDLPHGDARRRVYERLPRPRALAVHRRQLVWADWSRRQVLVANDSSSMSSEDRTPAVLLSDLTSVADLAVFHRRRRPLWSVCGRRAPCHQLCFSLPRSSQQAADSRTQQPAGGGGASTSVRHKCACQSHYSLAADGVTCAPPSRFLLYAGGGRLWRHLVSDGDNSDAVESDIMLPLTGVRQPLSLAYDAKNRHIYWIDGRDLTIRRTRPDYSLSTEFLSNSHGLIHPHSIQIDSYAGVMFWSCGRQNTVNVTRLNGSTVGTVLGGANSDVKPRQLALMPRIGLLAFINVALPVTLEVAAVDGTQRRVLVRQRRLHSPTRRRRRRRSAVLQRPSALAAVDEYDEDDTAATVAMASIYWADSGAIWTTDLRANSRVLVQDGVHGVVQHLVVLGERVFWSDTAQHTVQSVNRVSGTDRRVLAAASLHEGAPGPLLAVTPVENPSLVSHPCYGNGVCSHVCVSQVSSATEHAPLRHRYHQHHNQRRLTSHCSCPVGLLLRHRSLSQCDRPPTCGHDQWRCGGAGELLTHRRVVQPPPPACVPLRLRCDGRPDCADASDERHCPSCPSEQFPCPAVSGGGGGNSSAGACIALSRVCDGRPDCAGDGFDERVCCAAQFLCRRSRRCVPLTALCDGHAHCNPADDEWTDECRRVSLTAGHAGPSTSEGGGGGSGSWSVLVAVVCVLAVVTVMAVLGAAVWRRNQRRGGGGGDGRKCDSLPHQLGVRRPPQGSTAADIGSAAVPAAVAAAHDQLPLACLTYPSGGSPPPSAIYRMPSVSSMSSGWSLGRQHRRRRHHQQRQRGGRRRHGRDSARDCDASTIGISPPPYCQRTHITGASSSCSSGAVGTASTMAAAAVIGGGGCNPPPPPTPCSTDVYDSDSVEPMSPSVECLAQPPPPPPPPSIVGASSHRHQHQRPGAPPPSPVSHRWQQRRRHHQQQYLV